MTLRLSDHATEFPGDFIDSLLAGQTIFLCGTGISAPQMPDFPRLVDSVYDRLRVEKTPSEHRAFHAQRFEEVLGSLRRRLSDPQALTQTVSDLLLTPQNPDLAHHRTVLRLSRDLHNRVSVVTTNFDTLLEHALRETQAEAVPLDTSFAGQALPAPGTESFSGIIHLHGRLSDSSLRLDPTPLVLTSADYGDAYIRSAWASRFLFDLARCKTIVLIRYSANDAPVRYFLNVLHADRDRFRDLQPVYAFDAYHSDPREAHLAWGTLAVRTLPYRRILSDDGSSDHSPLWRALDELADIIERPTRSRHQRTRTILGQPPADLNDALRRELHWLFASRQDLWSVALDAIVDPAWFAVLADHDICSAEDLSWLVPAWIARDPNDWERLSLAAEWQRRLGPSVTHQLERRLHYARDVDRQLARAWRLLSSAGPPPDTLHYDLLEPHLTGDRVLDRDLQRAIHLLSPTLTFEHNPRHPSPRTPSAMELRDVVWPQLGVARGYEAQALIATLAARPVLSGRILQLTTSELQSTLLLQAELGLITDDYDWNDADVASIEQHAQNDHEAGVNALVRALVDALPQATLLEADNTRAVVRGWRRLPGRLGLRLCLHAMRDPRLFPVDEALKCLLLTTDVEFWAIQRETCLLLRDRATGAPRRLLQRLEKRIRNGGPAYFARYEIEPDEPDWRPQARDAAVWLRLNMLQQAGVLSPRGAAKLGAIVRRRDELRRLVEDRDFFAAYVSRARQIVPETTTIRVAPDPDRLRVAEGLFLSSDVGRRQGWSAYCGSDPHGAFTALSNAPGAVPNAAMWAVFLQAVAVGHDASRAEREEVAATVLDYLVQWSADALRTIAVPLVDLLSFLGAHLVDRQGWIERLWVLVAEQSVQPPDLTSDIYTRAINSPGGKLASLWLMEIEDTARSGSAPTARQLAGIGAIARQPGATGLLGRAELSANVGFLEAVAPACVREVLAPRVDACDSEGLALRALMVRYGRITPGVTRALGPAVVRGVAECTAHGPAAQAVAAAVLRPALAEVGRRGAAEWGIAAVDAGRALRDADHAIRRGALQVLCVWLGDGEGDVEATWTNDIAPLLASVWPVERQCQDPSLTSEWIELLVRTGGEFPSAVDQCRPYILPFDQGGSVRSVVDSDVSERFPAQTLDLLWLVCGPRSGGDGYDGLREAIDRVVGSDANVEVDRRLQWLHQRRLPW